MISEYPLDVIIVIAVLSELNHYLIINRASRSLAKTGFFGRSFFDVFSSEFPRCSLGVPGRHFLLILVPQGVKMELFWSHF